MSCSIAAKIRSKTVLSLFIASVILAEISCLGAYTVERMPVNVPPNVIDCEILIRTANIMRYQLKQRLEWFRANLSSFVLTSDFVDFLQRVKAPYVLQPIDALKDTFFTKQQEYAAAQKAAKLAITFKCSQECCETRKNIASEKRAALAHAFNEYREACLEYLFQFDRFRSINVINPEELSLFTCTCPNPVQPNHDAITIYTFNLPIKSIYTIDPQEQAYSAIPMSRARAIWFLPYCLSYKVPRTVHVVCDDYIYEWIIPHNICKGLDIHIWGSEKPEQDPFCRCEAEIGRYTHIEYLPLINKLKIHREKK